MWRHECSVIVGLGILAAYAVGGCGPEVTVRGQVNVANEAYGLVDRLLCTARAKPPKGAPILVASFVEADYLQQTSPFGRMMGQMCAARLSHHGYNVINMNLRQGSVVINASGEFLLSRDMKELTDDYQARAVLVGMYSCTSVPENIRSVDKMFPKDDGSSRAAEWSIGAMVVPAPRAPPKYEVIYDYVYVSLRLINPTDNSVMAAYDYRIRCDEGVRSLIGR